MIKKYLDTNVFIYPLLKEDAKAESCKKIIFKAVDKHFEGVTSILTWDEFVYTLQKFLGRKLALIEGEKFLKIPNLIFIDVTKRVVAEAHRLMKEYELKPRDAIHAATALFQNCDEIVSDDSDFEKLRNLKIVKPKNFKFD